ncbi:SCO family protein [Rummeliibacillus sp. TYF005]|uniref:SCO family protein n=1 Tax=unclassified Rummeliibacillus TaxID=2622809 RepID=UPI000E6729B0|nr:MULTISPECIES: SCO family protein [unclassified Rummeliibacillus]RIJ64846.1 SCO family protein [Rummeliibacillus sp. POC4]RPJ97442.1 SCO family protein [Rummeliibacillus sp. TYF005]
MKNRLIIASLVLVLSVLLSACGGSEKFKAETDWKVQDFSYTNQNGDKVSKDSLKGKPWLAMFIFTNCTTVCPPMTRNMTEIQESFKKKGLKDYRIVGFSVDPDTDTPAKLKKYLGQYPVADDSKWDLLTGYSQDDISAFALKSFKTLVKDDPNSNQVIHGSSFFLVNQDGVVVKNYSGYKDVPYDTIAVDMETLIEDGK